MGLLYAGGGNPIKGRTVKKKGISRQKLSGLRGVSSPLQLVLLAATGSILQLLVPPQLAPLQQPDPLPLFLLGVPQISSPSLFILLLGVPLLNGYSPVAARSAFLSPAAHCRRCSSLFAATGSARLLLASAVPPALSLSSASLLFNRRRHCSPSSPPIALHSLSLLLLPLLELFLFSAQLAPCLCRCLSSPPHCCGSVPTQLAAVLAHPACQLVLCLCLLQLGILLIVLRCSARPSALLFTAASPPLFSSSPPLSSSARTCSTSLLQLLTSSSAWIPCCLRLVMSIPFYVLLLLWLCLWNLMHPLSCSVLFAAALSLLIAWFHPLQCFMLLTTFALYLATYNPRFPTILLLFTLISHLIYVGIMAAS